MALKKLPPLRFHNTLSGELETFTPLSAPKVKMYNCGPTVYDEQHIGNLRGPLLTNLLKQTLTAWGYEVRHASNITDVGHLVSDADEGEDKMEKSAQKRGLSAQAIAQEITALFFADLDALGIDRSKIEFPKATAYIGEQIALVQTLKEKGYAYRTADGIYFDTAKFPAYGKLGAIDLAGQQSGARVEENPEKKNAHDFALWKFSKPGERREQEWDSPWGVGFPGWHIECTAMIFTLLGKQIDIHLGGIDLIPIHHNNEIAQAEAITGKQFVRYWMHNAFITIEGKKVSKSLGNTVYLHNLIDRGYAPRALRYWFLTGHYRTPMNFTWDAIEGADTTLKRLTRAYVQMPEGDIPDEKFLQQFYAAIANDLDTPKALALVWEHIKTVGRATMAEVDRVLGLGITDVRPSQKLAVLEDRDVPDEVQALAIERDAARADKDFTKADELRERIESLGYELKDTPEGPEIKLKK
jgi:cysteinyl-tRNA synthetase